MSIAAGEVSGVVCAQTLTTLVNFNGTDGANPYAGLLADHKGDLVGSTTGGGTSDDGTVFEILKSATGYATPTTLVNFNGSNGAVPAGNLIANVSGNLFGTTYAGRTFSIPLLNRAVKTAMFLGPWGGPRT
jgi:hypothetical protein